MDLKDAIEMTKAGLPELTTLRLEKVVGGAKDEETGGWRITVELLEKQSIPDAMDLFGIYEVKLNEKGVATVFERKGMRKRGETEVRFFE